MAIADIQITPPVSSLDPATRQGRFRVQVANQLGRDGRLQVSLLPVGEAKAEWLQLDEKHRQLALKKDETAVFDVTIAVPTDVAPGTYGFKLRCADDLDPANVKVDSEQRDFVVVAATVKPEPPSWRKWVFIAVAGAVLIGGGVALAIALTGGGSKTCDPACPAGQVCENGRCTRRAAGEGDAGTGGGGGSIRDASGGVSSPDACVEGAGVSPCGMCGGVLRCDGTCSVPSPANIGQSCNACGGKVTCNGCVPAPPAGFGTTCNDCGGKINCQGACAPAMPADFGRISVKYHDRRALHGGGTFSVGGKCDPNHRIADVTVQSSGVGGADCRVKSRGTGSNCTATISATSSPLFPAACETIITQRRVCDDQLFLLDRAVDRGASIRDHLHR